MNDVLARQLWTSDATATGTHLRVGRDTRAVVGVVRHVSHFSPGRESVPIIYAPQSQVNQRGTYTVVVRTTGAPESIAAARAPPAHQAT